MKFLIYIFFGIVPSIIWLLYYLRKDSHPESNRMILKIFFYGMLIAILAALIEIGFYKGLRTFDLPLLLVTILDVFIGIALTEEGLKYLVVRQKVLKSPEFDEPIDLMLYMIIAALGFVALENILLLWGYQQIHLYETIGITIARFISATLLHALCSGTLGYFVALSIFESKRRTILLFEGFGIAILLHGFYNFSIMIIEGPMRIIIPVIILLGLAWFVSSAFKKLSRIKSVCKIT